MQNLFKLILIFSIQFPLFSQIGTGEWRMHIANKAIDIAAGNGLVYAALETGLLEYDILANESSLWTNVNSLSDINISCVYFDETSKKALLERRSQESDFRRQEISNVPMVIYIG
jgi:hypothetical protein